MKKEDKELINATTTLMYLGAKASMRLPGDLHAKTVSFSLPEAIMEEAVKQFIRDTKRVLCIGNFHFVESDFTTPGEYEALRSKQVYISELHTQRAQELMRTSNIYLLNPYESWGSLQSTLGRAIAKIHTTIPEFAVVRPTRSYNPRAKEPAETVIDHLNFVFGEFWWKPQSSPEKASS